jgi:hypothetical protein
VGYIPVAYHGLHTGSLRTRLRIPCGFSHLVGLVKGWGKTLTHQTLQRELSPGRLIFRLCIGMPTILQNVHAVELALESEPATLLGQPRSLSFFWMGRQRQRESVYAVVYFYKNIRQYSRTYMCCIKDKYSRVSNLNAIVPLPSTTPPLWRTFKQ